MGGWVGASARPENPIFAWTVCVFGIGVIPQSPPGGCKNENSQYENSVFGIEATPWLGGLVRRPGPNTQFSLGQFACLELGLFRNRRPVVVKTKTVYTNALFLGFKVHPLVKTFSQEIKTVNTKTRFFELKLLHGWVGWCVGPARRPNFRLDCLRFWNWGYSAITFR